MSSNRPARASDVPPRHWSSCPPHPSTETTPVAIETQSTFEYRQNVVVRALTPGARPYDAIVEECFPPQAMDNPQAFFDAVGDEQKFQRNLDRMMASVGRFLDLGTIDVLATSQYRLTPGP